MTFETRIGRWNAGLNRARYPHWTGQCGFGLRRRRVFRLLAKTVQRAPRHAPHNETGEVTLAYLVKIYVGHVDHHMQFVKKKRELLGKPLA